MGNEKDTSGTNSWAEDRLCETGGDNVDGSEGSGAVYVDLDFATLQAITASIRT